ncbi:MAG: class I SAM-dependent methyltransferase [Tumebacillaceae bacterium]
MSNGPVFNFEGEYARAYEGIIRLVCPGYDNLYRMEEGLLHTLLGEQAHVLIAGAGGGMEVQTFAPANPNWRFTGVDPSTVMIESAQAKVTANGLDERVQLLRGFVHDLPAEAQFDGATCNLVLHFLQVEEKLGLLQSIYDRLKPGAAFVCSSMFGELGKEDFNLNIGALYRMALQSGFPQEKLDAMKGSLNGEMVLLPEEQTADLLRQVGFEKVSRFHTGLSISGWVARKPQ